MQQSKNDCLPLILTEVWGDKTLVEKENQAESRYISAPLIVKVIHAQPAKLRSEVYFCTQAGFKSKRATAIKPFS